MLTRRSLLSFSAAACAADWPQWRGPQRDGRASESGLARTCPSTGPRKIWQYDGLGAGYSSYSIAGGKLFTQGQKNGAQWVIALDANTGKKIWETKAGAAFDEGRGNGPRGTPTVDGDTLYALSADGTLVSLSTESGKKNWEMNILTKFNGRQIRWGLSESPLVDGQRLIVQPGGTGYGVVALDKKTGRDLWHAGDDEPGYSSAIAFDFEGQRHIVVFTGEGAMGFNAANGAIGWSYKKVSNRTANIATPLYHNGHVFLSSDYGTGCALLKLGKQGDRITASEVYFNRDMRNHYCSSVLVDQHVYGFSSTILTAMNLMTGEVAWKDRSVGKGQIILADKLLFLQGEDGTVALAEPTPTAYKELARFNLGRREYPVWTLPVVANGKLYLRDQERLTCFDASKG